MVSQMQISKVKGIHRFWWRELWLQPGPRQTDADQVVGMERNKVCYTAGNSPGGRVLMGLSTCCHHSVGEIDLFLGGGEGLGYKDPSVRICECCTRCYQTLFNFGPLCWNAENGGEQEPLENGPWVQWEAVASGAQHQAPRYLFCQETMYRWKCCWTLCCFGPVCWNAKNGGEQ